MLDKLLLQIASDLCSFCHLGNFLEEIPAGRNGKNMFTAGTMDEYQGGKAARGRLLAYEKKFV